MKNSIEREIGLLALLGGEPRVAHDKDDKLGDADSGELVEKK